MSTIITTKHHFVKEGKIRHTAFRQIWRYVRVCCVCFLCVIVKEKEKENGFFFCNFSFFFLTSLSLFLSLSLSLISSRDPDFPESLHRRMFRILEKFEVIHCIDGSVTSETNNDDDFYEKESLVPSLLPE